jgi:hypothetical protein
MHEGGVAAVEWKRGRPRWTADLCEIRTALTDGIGNVRLIEWR